MCIVGEIPPHSIFLIKKAVSVSTLVQSFCVHIGKGGWGGGGVGVGWVQVKGFDVEDF